jgi:Cu(I)/Ag(I) efflux system protein CusF
MSEFIKAERKKTMRKIIFVVASMITLSISALSQSVMAQSDTYDGIVTKIDESAGKITIRHGPMPKFDLDSTHTMVFRANDPAILKQVKAGDKVKFDADRINGQFTVTKIQKAK